MKSWRSLLPQAGGGAAIRSAFESAPIPAELEQAIVAAYDRLGQGPVAVRSSATAEDLPEASFAGQQDTFLNVVGTTALLQAVRLCWASLWTDRAITYRIGQGVDQLAVKLAVVVQRMVAAQVAGVMFTANPVTGARHETVVDASPGLGESVVSGLVTPDHFVLNRRHRGWQVAERRLGQREVIVQARPGGGTEHVKGPAMGITQALPDRALRRLARCGAAIERHFGAPQDIEWAWADGKPSILQARPITALPTPPARTARHGGLQTRTLQRFVAGNFVEMLPTRPYPLDLDSWMAALAGAVEPIFGLLGLDWSLRRLFEDEDGVIIRYRSNLPRPTWSTLFAPLRLALRILRYNPVHWESDALLAAAIARADQLKRQEPSDLSWEGLLALAHAARAIPFNAAGRVRARYFPRAAFALVRLRLMLGLLGRSGELGTLLSGDGNKTLEMNRALEELAQQVRSDPALAGTFADQALETLESALQEQPAGRAFLESLHSFFARYGHRETVLSTSLEPTWQDVPAVVLGIVKSFAADPPPPQAGKRDWQAARDALVRHPLLRFASLRAAFDKTLAEARMLLPLREDTHFYATLAMPLFRRTFLEMGRRLAAHGVLDSAEEVYHLRLAELAGIRRLPPPADLAASLRAATQRRKAARERLAGTPLADPSLFVPLAGEDDVLLRGTAGSPGVAEGPARVVRDISEFDRLVAGEVLVAPHTNPSWTPLFRRAAAVVVDSGSPASHAAIVAREYGIPAVMATITGTSTVRDGELIRVDGSRGTVSRVAAPRLQRAQTRHSVYYSPNPDAPHGRKQ